MGRPKGGPKYGGRQKGTPNKIKPAEQLAEQLGCNPLKILMHIAMNDWESLGYDGPTKENDYGFQVERIQLSDRKDAAKEVSKYLYAQKKAVDLTSSDGQGFKIVIEEFVNKKD